jgi:Tryptophan RNA-binding attenuator protein inhibitory protein
MDLTVDDLLPFCEKCSGTGEMENPALKQNEGSSYGTRVTWASPVDCDGCNGRGVIPTKTGESLLEFLQRAKAKRLL